MLWLVKSSTYDTNILWWNKNNFSFSELVDPSFSFLFYIISEVSTRQANQLVLLLSSLPNNYSTGNLS